MLCDFNGIVLQRQMEKTAKSSDLVGYAQERGAQGHSDLRFHADLICNRINAIMCFSPHLNYLKLRVNLQTHYELSLCIALVLWP